MPGGKKKKGYREKGRSGDISVLGHLCRTAVDTFKPRLQQVLGESRIEGGEKNKNSIKEDKRDEILGAKVERHAELGNKSIRCQRSRETEKGPRKKMTKRPGDTPYRIQPGKGRKTKQ